MIGRRSVAAAMLAVVFATATIAANVGGDRAKVEAIFAAHDKLQPGLEEYMSAVADDVVLMPNGGKLVEGKAAYRQHVVDFYASGHIRVRHEVVEVTSFPEVVIVQGRATGSFTPTGGGTVSTFQTHNLFILRRLRNGGLQVWRIIFNDAPKA